MKMTKTREKAMVPESRENLPVRLPLKWNQPLVRLALQLGHRQRLVCYPQATTNLALVALYALPWPLDRVGVPFWLVIFSRSKVSAG